jgi:hypothetical protein
VAFYRIVSDHKSNVGQGPVDHNCNNNSAQGYMQHFAPQDTDIISPRLHIPGGWLTYSGTAAETNDPYTWTSSYSIQPGGTGTIYQFTWSGASTLTVAPGAVNYISDPVNITIAKGTGYIIRYWRQAQNMRPPVATLTVSGGSLATTNISDQGQGLNTAIPVYSSSAATPLSAAVPAGAGAGSGGAISCVVSGGILTTLNLTAGSGYTDGTYPIVFANGANMARAAERMNGDGVQHGTSLPDVTMSNTSFANDGLGFEGPMTIQGLQSSPVPSIAVIGDSIFNGSSDQQDQPSGRIGAFEKSVGNVHGWTFIGNDGELMANYITRHSQEDLMAPYATHFINCLLRNDVAPGTTIATLQTRLVSIWTPYLAAGLKVYQITALPTTTSTDNWATTTNQTVANATTEAVRVQVNNWIRNTAPSLYGINVIDICTVMEAVQNNGLFNASAGGGASQLPRITINGSGVVTACTISGGVRYPISSAIPLEIFYPQGVPGSGLALTANTDGSGNITTVTVNSGGTGHLATNPPLVGVPGQYTIDGVHPSTYGHFKMAKAGLFAPSNFTLGGSTMSSGFKSAYLQDGRHCTLVFVRNNQPASNEYNGVCPKGGIVLDMVGGVIYQNTGTIDATTWAVLGSTLPASLNAASLPTADPHSTGSVWSNSGILTVSAG